MNEPSCRITQSDREPTFPQMESWMGRNASGYWKRIVDFIDQRYPGVFTPEWLYGGRKHGWSLRYKKGKSFCTLIPEKGRFALLIVFGAKERAAMESIRSRLSAVTRKQYEAATTFHDGKWLLLTVDTDRVAIDAECLLAVKRQPKPRL